MDRYCVKHVEGTATAARIVMDVDLHMPWMSGGRPHHKIAQQLMDRTFCDAQSATAMVIGAGAFLGAFKFPRAINR